METAPDNPARCPECESVRIAVDAYKTEKRQPKAKKKEHKAWCQNCNWSGNFSELILCGSVPLFGKIRCPECDHVHLFIEPETKKVQCYACKWRGTLDDVSFVHPEMVNS